MGDLPIAFTKSMDAFESHMALEKSLQMRHLRDLRKFHDEYQNALMKKDKIEERRVYEKIKQEVGWTVNDYVKILLKKTEKEEPFRRMLVILGITDEMLEEMEALNKAN
jgi:hypothetical protein